MKPAASEEQAQQSADTPSSAPAPADTPEPDDELQSAALISILEDF